MYWPIPAEMNSAAAQMVIYLLGAVAVWWTFLVNARA